MIGAIDGRGLYVEGPISEVTKTEVRFEVQRSVTDWGEPARRTTLILPPLAQRDRLEWLAEKAVELGLTRLMLVHTARSEPSRPNLERLQRLMLAALKQCHRSRLPELVGPLPLAEALGALGPLAGFRGVGAIGAARGLPEVHSALAAASEVSWLLGPPADFTQGELAAAEAAGFVPVALGSTRLRSETAALYALSASKAAAGA